MVYIPAPSAAVSLPSLSDTQARSAFLAGKDLMGEIERWREEKISQYSAEMSLVERLKREVLCLREKVGRR